VTVEYGFWLSNTDSLLEGLSNAEGLVLIDADALCDVLDE